MEYLQYDEIESAKVHKLINNKESFQIIGLSGKMSDAVSKIENIIESKNLSCRIFTYGRVAAAGGSLFGGITGVLGLASAVGMAAHNLATYDPDYEIAKHVVDNKLCIDYKK